ncbi:hypothetical protein R5R35_005745 [Gryllus longicercus]|uniref:Fibrinogen C-terminal domain-containing protein n=1 Tax=Gryllus longicercus TaxID=2509291 RepID=A0AAN9ZIY8_9ORTH
MDMCPNKYILFLSCFIIWTVNGSEENVTIRQPTDHRIRPARRGHQRGIPNNKQNASEENSTPTESASDELLGQAIGLLQRLNDRLTALQALDEQQIRRLETLEYRFTKLEVQQQEKVESLRTELREVARRVQQQDWQTNKIDTLLESVKLDIAGLTQGQEHLRGLLSVPETRYPTLVENDIKNKLQTLIAINVGIKGITTALFDTLTHIGVNITHLNNMTRLMVESNNKLVTKQHLKNLFLDFHKSPPMNSLTNHLSNSKEQLPWDCSKVKENGFIQSGVYRIQPPKATQPFYVYCDMETKGGGWTVIQNRYEGTIDFNRGWEDYKFGFGNLGGEFWIGLEKIYLLTNYKVNELNIELTDFAFTKTYAHYKAFAIGDEIEGYPMRILGGYDGDAGDSLIYHAGMKFSTYDMDNDGWNDGNCAESHTGAWWYNGCDTSNLNGRYLGGELVGDYEYQGIYWYDWRGPMYSLMKTRMAIRPTTEAHAPLNNIKGDKKPSGQDKQRNKTTPSPPHESREETTISNQPSHIISDDSDNLEY